MSSVNDSELLKPWLKKQLNKLGLKTFTPIQKNCIPMILQGKVNIFSFFEEVCNKITHSLPRIALEQQKLDLAKPSHSLCLF